MALTELTNDSPAWLNAHIGFMRVAHIAELGIARYENEQRDLTPGVRACFIAILEGRAEEARRRAAERTPFEIRAVPSMPSIN